MNFTLLSSIFTVFSLLVFLGIMYWAYSKENRQRFEELGRLPFEAEENEWDTPVTASAAQAQAKSRVTKPTGN